MDKNLPARPNLDHLRRQAKALLAALSDGDAAAVATIQDYLPAARGKAVAEVHALGIRLADAQSAIARKTGFASWPQLSRHVDQLRALEGSWAFARMIIDGSAFPPAALNASRLLIDGDRFRTESPEAVYEGIFTINVEAQPHEIDIEFVAGPEAGNWNYGVFRLDGDALEICLDVNGKPRPTGFVSSRGSGHVFEALTRSAHARPADVTGGSPTAEQNAATPQAPPATSEEFEYLETPLFAQLAGEWAATRIVLDGKDLPQAMLGAGVRVAARNEIWISFGGQTMIHALIRLDETANPVHVDYYNLDGAARGTIQHGILSWMGDEACFCIAAPGRPRPEEFTSPAGSGRTLSQWRPKK
ncbi:MAG: TIGR03067 domain-containing protein [Planctomycetales bacterium]|nr:TIGR03067 domain-containing protein [Planctomycetales bacterium]